MRVTFLFLAISIAGLSSCIEYDPNYGQAPSQAKAPDIAFVGDPQLTFRDTVYIPIYSDIYSETKDVKFNLTATLSIRNTSFQDTIYVSDIDYYDSEGELIRHYLDSTLLLRPMQSVDYVIEEDDTQGGTGPNFIVNWGANNQKLKPIFQGVMISTHGQQGISFLTNGLSISKQ
ncbi:DUF3124 domain-containing protein [Ekhidna sp.]